MSAGIGHSLVGTAQPTGSTWMRVRIQRASAQAGAR